MAIRTFKPTSPGRRGGSCIIFDELTTSTRNKKLSKGKKSSGGRNNIGRRTSNHRGGGHKRTLRLIDFRRDKHDIPATVATIEYDPNRSANIALLHYHDGEKRYIVAPVGLKPGMKIIFSLKQVDAEIGVAMPLEVMPVGTVVHNVELTPGNGAQFVRSAGAQARLMSREGKYATVELPSGELRRVLVKCMATVGQVGNMDHSNIKYGKAGRKRWLGVRPSSRGMAMNPVAHPMGGGEGRSKSGAIPQSKTGVLAKGGKTRNPNKPSTSLIIRKRK
jgi:large subunit ribosomal protein L2